MYPKAYGAMCLFLIIAAMIVTMYIRYGQLVEDEVNNTYLLQNCYEKNLKIIQIIPEIP